MQLSDSKMTLITPKKKINENAKDIRKNAVCLVKVSVGLKNVTFYKMQ